jgi:dTDP-glucose 4,6-dehydratase
VVIHRAVAGDSIPVYGSGLQVRDWLHVEDHCEALWRVLILGRDGATYNIGARNEWTNLDLVHLVCGVIDELTGKPKGRAASRIASVADRPGHDVRYAIDPGRIERELGWRPLRSFEDGIRETVQWYLGNRAWVDEVLGAKIREAHG